jgi:uncharacterized protein (DUF1778 family)
VITRTRKDARINVRLPSKLKRIIEDAAATLGQTVTEFAISTVVREARQVLQDAQVTRLSNRDRNQFLKALFEFRLRDCSSERVARDEGDLPAVRTSSSGLVSNERHNGEPEPILVNWHLEILQP